MERIIKYRDFVRSPGKYLVPGEKIFLDGRIPLLIQITEINKNLIIKTKEDAIKKVLELENGKSEYGCGCQKESSPLCPTHQRT